MTSNMIDYCAVSLAEHLNATASTYDHNRSTGQLNAWGNSFPAEEIPSETILSVSGIPFLLPAHTSRGDHVEALGQSLAMSGAPAFGVALLCFGEMGEQELELRLMRGAQEQIRFAVRAPGWLVDERDRIDIDHGYCCSHLHYPGDYELARFHPTLWCCERRWTTGIPLTSVQLGDNPLFHIFSVTVILSATTS